MNRLTPIATGALLGLAVSSCAPVASPVDVVVMEPDPSSEGGVHLVTRTLHSVEDLYAGRSSHVDFVTGDFDLGKPVVDALAERFSGGPEKSFREQAAALRAGARPIAPSFTFDGDRYVADDFDSLHYASALWAFERVFAFAEGVGVEESAREKSVVFMHSRVRVFGVYESFGADNAAYSPALDSWSLYPVVFGYLDGQDVPPMAHDAVVAHEFGHRVFRHAIFVGEELGWSPAGGTLPSEGLDDDEMKKRDHVLKGLNEGFADLFAIAYAGDAAVIGVALDDPDRSLVSEEVAQLSYDALLAGEVAGEGLCRPDDASVDPLLGTSFYCVGTTFAVAVFEGVGGDVTALEERVLPALVRVALPALGARLAGEEAFGPALLLDEVAAALDDEDRAGVCAAYAVRFASLLEAGEVPACSR